jgi:hypothetical protein
MKTYNAVKQAIKHLTRENFTAYPEDLENGDIVLKDLAHRLWETRRETEVERDEKLGITEEDYYDFVSEANEE